MIFLKSHHLFLPSHQTLSQWSLFPQWPRHVAKLTLSCSKTNVALLWPAWSWIHFVVNLGYWVYSLHSERDFFFFHCIKQKNYMLPTQEIISRDDSDLATLEIWAHIIAWNLLRKPKDFSTVPVICNGVWVFFSFETKQTWHGKGTPEVKVEAKAGGCPVWGQPGLRQDPVYV